ncbi:MAG: hypothetical protein M1829_003987 [Trizodia sp. TS-e1964]|nr:MAG: hypothetical protein M1829_003987 [Trizodia sp. TS-e1964]
MFLSAAVYAPLCCLSFALLSAAATVTYDFNITWVTANPDGAFDRPTMGINGQWPIPAIMATVGDVVIINVNNQLGNRSTGLHFHGLYQNGTPHMDGAVGVTQCEILPGNSFKYNFTINQPGTYWYHSHVRGQYPDGLRGPLIVEDPASPYKGKYDEEVVLTLSDWYHDQMPSLIAKFLNKGNPRGAEPVPDAALFNDTQNLNIAVQPGKTYLFRLINIGAFAAQYFWIEGHDMMVVEVDGVYTESTQAKMIYIAPAQRYSFLVTTKNQTDTNFAISGSMDEDLFDKVPDGLNPNVTGWLIYNPNANLPAPVEIVEFDPFDDFALVPHDGQKLYEKADYSITLDLKMGNLGDGANYAFFNDISWVAPKVPTLYSALSTGDAAMDPVVYGVSTNSYTLKKDDIVEIILNSNDPGKHPFHLHGHTFQAIVRADEEAGAYADGNDTFPSIPMRRDTLLVRPNSHFVIRFKADNPDKLPVK